MNATSAYRAMWEAVGESAGAWRRTTTDPASPTQGEVLEAYPGCQFHLDGENVVNCRRINRRWATANILHFFEGTEDAGILRRYNPRADLFLSGDRLVGAYGPLALPGVHRCVDLLRVSPDTRRAIVTMPDARVEHTINSPPCWTSIHFLHANRTLDALVYQRSLSLAVMPYDVVLFMNILRFVASSVGLTEGQLIWTIGSLHGTLDNQPQKCIETSSIYVDREVLNDPVACHRSLHDGLGSVPS